MQHLPADKTQIILPAHSLDVFSAEEAWSQELTLDNKIFLTLFTKGKTDKFKCTLKWHSNDTSFICSVRQCCVSEEWLNGSWRLNWPETGTAKQGGVWRVRGGFFFCYTPPDNTTICCDKYSQHPWNMPWGFVDVFINFSSIFHLCSPPPLPFSFSVSFNLRQPSLWNRELRKTKKNMRQPLVSSHPFNR